ncbi:sulfur carrier protein ThiS [Roseovarius sp. A21]|uniref:Sulfur carrier protein ThiS n=1 Tax=Roseovarius bejariae TaxID=2576383 RepID=A0A844CNG6_9RHOB|nr:sulfur carrier protein ThiS [Roseovarius bejariae]MRU16357.1 sulfur carrier protein ThiS [Roseovarius bejariae]
MKIVVNGDPREVTAATLSGLLAECGFSGRVATAVNEAFVPAGLREQHRLNEGDRVEIVAPMQGG